MLDRFVGIPFKDGGRDFSGADCWGLLRLVYAEHGVDLPSFSEDYATAADHAAIARLIAGSTTGWRDVAEADVRPLDGVLMTKAGVEAHVGVVVRRGFVLHAGLELGTSRIEPYTSMRLRRRVSRFLRHEAMDAAKA